MNVAAVGEAGLLGVALPPDFETTRQVYVAGAFRAGNRLVDRVLRLTDQNGRGVSPGIVVDNIPAEKVHAGNAIAFGPDGMLYVATGDAREPPNAQESQSVSGKILRYRPDGTPASDNPDPTSPG